MKKVKIFINGQRAGVLSEIEKGRSYRFDYDEDYQGDSISLTMPVENKSYTYDCFPPFFDGLLPEGVQLEALLKRVNMDLMTQGQWR